VLSLHVEVEPGMRIGPVHFLERAAQDEVLGDVELRLDRVMSVGRRGSGERERSQQGEQCRLAHSAFSSIHSLYSKPIRLRATATLPTAPDRETPHTDWPSPR